MNTKRRDIALFTLQVTSKYDLKSKSRTQIIKINLLLRPGIKAYCDIKTEKRVVTRLRHSKRQVSVTKIMHATIEELLEAVFSAASAPPLLVSN
jgi:hypothetical protein